MRKAYHILYRVVAALLILGILINLWLGLSPRLLGDPFPTVLGYAFLQVDSGSMAPAIQTGDAIIIHKERAYEEGDIITFYQEELYITHRIVKKQDTQFTTKGDANNASDPVQVDQEEIYGKVAQVVPKGGIILRALHDPLVITGVAMSAGALWLIVRVIRRQKRGEAV